MSYLKNLNLHNYILVKISILVVFLTLSSCQSTKSYKDDNQTVEFESRNKFMTLKAPKGYCFYDEKIPLENDVIKILRQVHSGGESKIEFLFQECLEKKAFVENINPSFRNTVMIISASDYDMKAIRQYGVDKKRKLYVDLYSDFLSISSVKSMNKHMDALLKKTNKNPKIVDESINLKKEQKEELKLVHGQIFEAKRYLFLAHDVKYDPGFAAYDYQTYKIGNIITKCIGAHTLINYIPLTIAFCEDKKSDDWDEMEKRIKKYLRLLMELNDDLPLER